MDNQPSSASSELRSRIFFTFFILLIYRFGVFVPTPGIDVQQLKDLMERSASNLFGLVNMFSGGAVENVSVFALGIIPYIGVSIMVQLLTSVYKPLEELSSEGGEAGRRIITKYTRIGTICLALFQGFVIAYGLESQGLVFSPGLGFKITTAITLACGTAFLMWVGEQINERGIGNGISVIIMAGIVARMPGSIMQTFSLVSTGEITRSALLLIILFAIATLAFIVFVERSQRQIPVQYPRRAVSGGKMSMPTAQFLPFKVNNAGVMPPIFATSLIFFPIQILTPIFQDESWFQSVSTYMLPPNPVYLVIFALLNIFFCYFWVATVPQYNPDKIADNLKKNGGFIPSVRPGKETAKYIQGVLSRLTFWGAIYICIVCIVPTIFYNGLGAASFDYVLGGTAVLIIVGVTLDIASQVESFNVSKNYEDFMAKSPGKVRGVNQKTSQVKGKLIQR